MRYARLGVMLAFTATPAFAQPTPETPAEPPPAEPSEPAQAPADAAKPQEPSPTPEVAKDIVKDPPRHETVSSGPEAGEPHPERGFRFGSYGRVLAGSDLRGGKPERVKITAVAPRIVEPSYLELEFSYGFDKVRAGRSEIVLRPIVTLAFDDTLFHETGEFDAQPALRNMFVDGKIGRDLSMWVGSRMYRGDDIYLFDYWPLDDINTVGGGVQYSPAVSFREGSPDRIELAAHVGFNRLLDEFQFQETEVANPVQGATIVEQLNRQRTIASASAAYVAMPNDGGPGGKLKVHVESHSLPSGTRKRMDGTFEDLPSDSGFLIGAQLGAFGFSKDERFRRHANLFVRYSKGLAAFDELAPPTSFGDGLDTGRAAELTIGASANWDHSYGNLMVGALSRRFIDADENTTDPDDGWEYALDARPLVRLFPDWFVGADVSYQARFPKGLNPITLRAEDPAIFQLAPMLAWSPMGPSGYDRPQIRLVYRAAYLNEGARNLYVPDDPRHDDKVVHFLGLQCEWWFNSSTYR